MSEPVTLDEIKEVIAELDALPGNTRDNILTLYRAHARLWHEFHELRLEVPQLKKEMADGMGTD